MRGPNPSAVVVALSTVVAVSTVGFMVSVLGNAGGASATLPIPGITGSAAPEAEEVAGPPPIEVGPGASDDAPVAGDAPADPETPTSSTNGNGTVNGNGPATGVPSTGGGVADGPDDSGSPLIEPEPTPVPPGPATPVTPPKPTEPPSSPGKPDHANPGNGNGNGNGSSNGSNGHSNKP